MSMHLFDIFGCIVFGFELKKDEIDEISQKSVLYVMAQPKSIISSLVIFLQM